MNKRLGPMVVLSLVMALGGCGSGDVDDLKDWMKEQGDNLRGTVQPLPPYVPYNPVVYDATEPDPFSLAKLDVEKHNKPPTGLAHKGQPLEAYDVEKLVMRGTLQYVSKSGHSTELEAIVETPDKTVYPVRKNDQLGQNFGVVTNITESGIELKETVEDSNGEWVERKTTIPMADKEQK